MAAALAVQGLPVAHLPLSFSPYSLFPLLFPCCWVEFISASNSHCLLFAIAPFPTTSGDRWLVVLAFPLADPLAVLRIFLSAFPYSVAGTEVQY